MRNKNTKGFSIIELAVVMAIMAIMSAIIVPRYSSYKNAKSMSYARTQIMNDIRYAQTYTLSTKKMPDASSPNGISPTGGYGIHFQKGLSTYVVFGDRMHGAVQPNRIYDTGSAENELFETVSMVSGVTIKGLKLTKGASVSYPTRVDYVSVPPYGKVYIDNTADNVTLEITFGNGTPSMDSTITINSSGFIN